MSIDVSASISTEMAKREGIGLVDLFILNASYSGFDPLYFANWNHDVRGFSISATGDLLATTTVYTGLPITREAVKTNVQGEISGLAISIPNTDRGIEAYIQNRRNLRGCEVFIITTFTKHLPSGSSAAHIGTAPDRFAMIKEKVLIDAVSSNEAVVSFTCKPKLQLRSKQLPGRTFTRECSWAQTGKYAATECSPSNQINATRLASYPTCDGSLDNCTTRKNKVRYGGFPSIPDKGIAII